MKTPLNVLLFGGCLLRRPLRSVPDLESKLDRTRYGRIRVVHSFAEMIQVVEFLRGQKEVPQALRRLTGIAPETVPMPNAVDFHDIDLALIEPGSPVDIDFRGIAINRTAIMDLLRPIERQSKEAAKLCHSWARTGVVGMDDEVRKDLGARLTALLPDDENRELRRAVIAETRAVKSDIAGGFRKMRALLGCPLGAVIFIFRYMPDGRPIVWPAGSRDEVIRAAQELGLPTFEPTSMVQEYGVEAALEKDMQHYSEAFLPVVGAAIVRFAQDVYARSRTAAEG
jgi:hypothetical protein